MLRRPGGVGIRPTPVPVRGMTTARDAGCCLSREGESFDWAFVCQHIVHYLYLLLVLDPYKDKALML